MEGINLALFQPRVKVESSEKELGNKSHWNVISVFPGPIVIPEAGGGMYVLLVS